MTPPAAAAAIPAALPSPTRRGAPAAPARPARPRPSRPRPAAVPRRHLGRQGRAAEVAAALAPARLLDRLIRSRSWIGVVAFALIGIVAMQLWLLKLNGGIGRAIEHEGLLQRENAVLSAENSSMSAGDLIEQQAVASGLRIASPGSLVFLRARGPMDERLAAARLARPVQTPAQSEGVTAASTPAASTSTPAASTSTPAASTSTPTASTSTPSENASSAPATESAAPTRAASATESAAPTSSTPATTESAAPTPTSTTPEAGG